MPCMNYSLTGVTRFLSADVYDYGSGIQGIKLFYKNYWGNTITFLEADIEEIAENREGIRINKCVFKQNISNKYLTDIKEIFVHIKNWNTRNIVEVYVYPRRIKMKGVEEKYPLDTVNIEVPIERLLQLRQEKEDAVCEFLEIEEEWICLCGAVNISSDMICGICGTERMT